jgi:hypothetical protein
MKLAKKNSDFADSSTKKSLALAESSNENTRRTVAIMDSSMKIDNRAYLIINRIEPSSEYVNNFWIIINNVGKTPAFNVHCSRIMLSANLFGDNKTPTIIIDTTQSMVIGGNLSGKSLVTSNITESKIQIINTHYM